MLAFDRLDFDAPSVREIDEQTGYLKVAATPIAKEGVREYKGYELAGQISGLLMTRFIEFLHQVKS